MNRRCPNCKGKKFSVRSLAYQTFYSDDERWEDIHIEDTEGKKPYYCMDCQEEFEENELEEYEDEDEEEYNYEDWCGYCQKKINQIELDSGRFGCPICLSDNNIILYPKENTK